MRANRTSWAGTRHIRICLRAFMKTIYEVFHVVQGKYRLISKKIPLLLFIAGIWYREDIPHSISDHMLTVLILVGLILCCCISFPRTSIELSKACILNTCLFCLYILLGGLRVEWTIIVISSVVLELFIVMILWDNPIILLIGPSDAIHLGIWVYSWTRK